MYRKLKRAWSHGYIHYMPNFDEAFPELRHLRSDEMCDRFQKLGIEFYTEKQEKVRVLTRLSMPIAIVVMVLMFMFMPINYLITGRWSYRLGKKNKVLNWFRAVKLLK